MALKDINTIILLMYENRSFDHMLGHLSLQNLDPTVNGLKLPLDKYENIYNGGAYLPYQIPADIHMPFDIPHEWDAVAKQFARSSVNGRLSMNGFVEAYAKFTNVPPNPQAEPMGYYAADQVPITSFLARKYCVCDSWFSPLPTSTQPNRTLAFCGETNIYKTGLQAISASNNVFDWLDKHQVDWRVYHDGFSFFALYPELWHHVFGKKFRDYENLYSDMIHNDVPQVIVVEPTYQEAPHFGSDYPNDNHAPSAIGAGEEFLRRTYEAAIANPDIWEHTLMIVYYDEHGGFYDHVPPPNFVNKNVNPPASADGTSNNFRTLGARVPALLISPWVQPGSVAKSLFDHTSVLQLLAERFTPGQPYSAAVDTRRKQAGGIKSVSEALSNTPSNKAAPPPPSAPIYVRSALGGTIAMPSDSDMGKSFEMAAKKMIADKPAEVRQKYPELFQWQAAVKTRVPV
jgi:phospholipase C